MNRLVRKLVEEGILNGRFLGLNRKQFIWPIAGIVAVTLAGVFLPHREISFTTGLIVWSLDLLVVVMISGTVAGARFAAVLAGLCMAVPGCNSELALFRFVLMCLMAVPLIVATGLVLVRPIAGVRARMGYVCSWFGAYELRRLPSRFEWGLFLKLVAATSILAAGIFAVKAAPASDGGLIARWLGGGIAIFAFAEMITVAFPLMAEIAGVTVPPFFRSPYRAESIGEFWGQRWNVAASKLFGALCYVPLARRSVALGLVAAFAASAIAHALMALMAIGSWKMFLVWGAFFLIQPLFIGFERWINIRRRPIWARRCWTLGGLAVTCPLFVEPMARIIESAWGGRDEIWQPVMVALCTVTVLGGGFVAASRFALSGRKTIGNGKNGKYFQNAGV